MTQKFIFSLIANTFNIQKIIVFGTIFKEKEIYNFTPIQCISNDTNSIVTHFDYNLIDGNLLKLHLLQNEKFTILKRLQELTGVDPTRIPLDDKETINLFNETDKINKEILQNYKLLIFLVKKLDPVA